MSLIARHLLSGEPVALEFVNDRCVRSPAPGAGPGDVYLSPGWVDLQVNGFAGVDLNAGVVSPEDVGRITRRLWREGVTRYCPTVITQSAARIEASLRAIAAACESDAVVRASVLGIHLEGPYLSPVDGARGAHPLEHIRPPDWEEFQHFQEAAHGGICLVTLAPEQPGAVTLIERLVRAGVVVAIGHTLATTDELRRAVDAGASLSTHLGNGAPALLPRHPNMIWDQLADDRLFASAIFDGHHLPASVMKTLVRAKGLDRLILVSDAAALARMPPGVYADQIGGKVELSPNGRLSQYGTPYLAGSASALKDCVENAVAQAGCSLAQACGLASVNPAAVMRSPSAPDDLTLFQWDAVRASARILATIVGGAVRYFDGNTQPE